MHMILSGYVNPDQILNPYLVIRVETKNLHFRLMLILMPFLSIYIGRVYLLYFSIGIAIKMCN